VYYYAMQFIDGQTLAALIAELRQTSGAKAPAEAEATGPYTPAPRGETAAVAALSTERSVCSPAFFRRVAELGRQAALALDHAHQMGVIHRDVKPGNLMLDGRGSVWITDFGLAHCQGQASLTMTGDLVGTLRYMSPEQALARRVVVDHRTDVYSLGATLYELLTLEPVFTGQDRQELLREIAFDEPRPPRRLNKAIPAELETIVLKAVEKNPADRYATAQEMADDLEHFLKDEPIRAKRATLVQRGRKWARRHRAVVWSAAVCGLVAVVLAGAGLGFIAGERAERHGKAADALQEANQALAEGNEPGARAAAERVAGLLTGAGGDHRLQQRLEQLEADLVMLAELEFARLQQAEVKDGAFDNARADPLYAAAFRKYNLPVLELEPADAARRIAASAIREQLLAALEDWASIHQTASARFKQLADLVRRADDDPWRKQVFFAALDKRDWPRVVRLAQQPEALDQPPARLVVLGGLLARIDRPAAVKFLRQAQQRHPDDVWINHNLAVNLKYLNPPRLEEAIGFYRAAVAARRHSPGVRFNLAMALRAHGQIAEAESQYREAIRLKPDYAEAHDSLGALLCDDKHDYDGAVAAFRAALRLRPNDAIFQYNLGHPLLEKGELDEAIACYRKAIELDPNYAHAHYNLGNALKAKGKVDDAIACYRKTLALDPKDARAPYNLGLVLQAKGKVDEAIACYQKAIALDPKDAMAHMGLGVILCDVKRNYDGASACFRKAIALDPKEAKAHTNLGVALAGKGQLEEAIACFRKAIALDPKFALAHTHLGLALKDQGKVEEAIACYQKAIALDPKNAEAHRGLGGILCDGKRDYDGAIACFRQAIALDPKNAKAHYDLGIALWARGKVDEAIVSFRKAIDIDPRPAKAHLNLGIALKTTGKVDEAIACYRKAIDIDPRYAAAHYNLGIALHGQGKIDDAIACYRKAIEIDPRFAKAHNKLGNALYAKGKMEEAIACFQKAIALEPKHANAHGALGQTLMQLGEFSEAEKTLRRCLALLPANHQLRGVTSQLVRQCQQLIDADGKLNAFLAGQGAPADAVSQVQMASLAQQSFKQLYLTAARLYRDAFARQPRLADVHRYSAACAAALAGCGQGKDAGNLDEQGRGRWRKQALAWLRADLTLREKQLRNGEPAAAADARQALQHWQRDADLAGVRGSQALANLPEAERREWQQLWAQVQQLLEKTGGKTPPPQK
jgi:tetratricopeptide (TPR) repeat protein